MNELGLHEFHRQRGAHLGAMGGREAVMDYGDVRAEHAALRQTAGVLDLSFRGRVCVVGADRVRFLNGQVTNNIKDLKPGHGCYAALTTNKGKIQSDLNIHCLADELLLDFEPGLTALVTERLEKFIVADDVQLVDVTPHYGLLSVQGPQASAALAATGLFPAPPTAPFQSGKFADAALGDMYVMHMARGGVTGFDVFVPVNSLATVAERLWAAAQDVGGRGAGWSALELARIEAGVPRFGADMDDTNLPHEAGIEMRAVSFTKGCYIGQEVINRIRSFGQVSRALRGLRLPAELPALPLRGDKLLHGGKEVGHITSAADSPVLNANIALGYVRKECNAPGTELTLRTAQGEWPATIAPLPFVKL
jgi:folate-binding protein YgfZ